MMARLGRIRRQQVKVVEIHDVMIWPSTAYVDQIYLVILWGGGSEYRSSASIRGAFWSRLFIIIITITIIVIIIVTIKIIITITIIYRWVWLVELIPARRTASATRRQVPRARTLNLYSHPRIEDFNFLSHRSVLNVGTVGGWTDEDWMCFKLKCLREFGLFYYFHHITAID